mgnify:FL=1
MGATRACALSDLEENTAKRVVIGGVPIAVVLDSQGVVHAIGDTCTHGEVSLSEGFVEDDLLECWAHGSQFSLTTGIPQNLPAYEPVPVFVVEIVGNDVMIDHTKTKEV